MTPLSYTLTSASAATGLPTQTLRDHIRRGHIPAIKSGRRLIILAVDLEAFLLAAKARGAIAGHASDQDRERLARLNRSRQTTGA